MLSFDIQAAGGVAVLFGLAFYNNDYYSYNLHKRHLVEEGLSSLEKLKSIKENTCSTNNNSSSDNNKIKVNENNIYIYICI